MAELRDSNQADVSVFMFLSTNGQSIRPFSSSNGVKGMGPQPMQELVYFNSAATKDMLKQNAALMAHMLIAFINTYYTQQREKAYEKKTVPDLVAELVAIMIVPDKTVSDLANKADDIFRYASEETAAVPLADVANNVQSSASTNKKLSKLGIK